MEIIKIIVCILPLCFVTCYRTKYTVKVERFEIPFLNKTYFNYFAIETFFPNRTVKALRGKGSLKKELDKQTKIRAAAAKYISNTYRQGAIQYTGSLQQVMSIPQLAGILKEFCTPSVSWPIKTSVNYKCGDWVPEFPDFGIYFPAGRWKVTASIFLQNSSILEAEVYSVVEENVVW